jgi:GMP synthase (glutamine-hydrolysing)
MRLRDESQAMQIHCIAHAPFETPGAIAGWASARGHALIVTSPCAHQNLPDATQVEFLILLGGPQSPLHMDDFPYLRDEIELTAEVMRSERPVVGLCLGCQLIAEALGARTSRSPQKEVGTFPVQLTGAARQDPILKVWPPEVDVLHWHNDMPGIPDGAVLLARSAGCPHQAFRFGDRTYGFQFHLEPTLQSIRLLLDGAPEDLAASRYTQTPSQILSSDFTTMNGLLAQILDSLVALAAG